MATGEIFKPKFIIELELLRIELDKIDENSTKYTFHATIKKSGRALKMEYIVPENIQIVKERLMKDGRFDIQEHLKG